MENSHNNMRQRILDGASRLFLQYGYKRTTMDDIAVAVGVSKGSLYLHFDSKEAIFDAVSDDIIAVVLGDMRQIQESDSPVDRKLQEIFLGALLRIWDFCHQAPHAPDIWAEAMTQAGPRADRGYRAGREVIARVIAQGQAEGVFLRRRGPRRGVPAFAGGQPGLRRAVRARTQPPGDRDAGAPAAGADSPRPSPAGGGVPV